MSERSPPFFLPPHIPLQCYCVPFPRRAPLTRYLHSYAIPESTCNGDLACLSTRSGDVFLEAFGFDTVDVAVNAELLCARWLLYVLLAWLFFTKAANGLTFRGALRDVKKRVEQLPRHSKERPKHIRYAIQ